MQQRQARDQPSERASECTGDGKARKERLPLTRALRFAPLKNPLPRCAAKEAGVLRCGGGCVKGWLRAVALREAACAGAVGTRCVVAVGLVKNHREYRGHVVEKD